MFNGGEIVEVLVELDRLARALDVRVVKVAEL
jgi:hypothetical protein